VLASRPALPLPFSLFTQENIAMPDPENSFDPSPVENTYRGADLDPRANDYRNDLQQSAASTSEMEREYRDDRIPVTIAAAGTGYAINDTGTFAAGVIYKVTAIGENGAVTAVSISPQHLRLLNDHFRGSLATTVTTGSGDGALKLNVPAFYTGQRVLHANPFFLSRTKATHYGDQIQFATHPNRSLSIFDATVLCAWLAFLIDDDKAVSVELDNLRQRPYVKAVAAPHEVENMDMSLPNAPTSIDSRSMELQQESSAPQTQGQMGQPAEVFDNSLAMPENVAEQEATQERNNEKQIAKTQSQESNTARQGRSPRRTGTV
jgi:hypothetical protein